MRMQKQLYGSRLAPLRLWIRISEGVRLRGYRQNRLEVCVYTLHHPTTKRSESIIVLHVGDFLVYSPPYGHKHFRETMSIFTGGDYMTLKQANPIVYLGANRSMSSDGGLGLGQQDFIDRMRELPIQEFVSPNCLAQPHTIKTRFRQILGSFIWLIQTQQRVAFMVTRFATEATHRSDCVRGVREMVALANKIARTLAQRPLAIWYAKLFPRAVYNEDLQSLRLFTFSDCGFGTLLGGRSVESVLIALAKPIRRDGGI